MSYMPICVLRVLSHIGHMYLFFQLYAMLSVYLCKHNVKRQK